MTDTPTIHRRADADRNDPFLGIAIGSKARDTLTGFTGLVTARIEYATGCNQVLLAPPVAQDQGWRDAKWFDVERVAVLEEKAITFTSRPGGGLPTGQTPPTKREGL